MVAPEYAQVHGRRIALVRNLPEANHIVVMCHGLHSSLVGDHFDLMEAQLAPVGIGTLRFDQYGNGRSDGTPAERRFSDWVDLTLELIHGLQAKGHQVSVLGTSIGGAAALIAASVESALLRCVAWVPGLGSAPKRRRGDRDFVERGERMDWEFWRQYQAADVIGHLRTLTVPTLMLLATQDEYEGPQARARAMDAAGPAVTVELLERYHHTGWTEPQATRVVERTMAFLTS